MKESEKKLRGLRARIRKMLREAGKWAPEMGYQVEQLATDLLVYRRLRDDIMENGVTMTERSREGYPRERPRPSMQLFKQYGDAVRADLKVLLMNRALDREDGGSQGDELLAKLMEG